MQPFSGRYLVTAAILVYACMLLLPGHISYAQTADPARAARIRGQMGAQVATPANETDLNALRSDLTKAMEAVVDRIGVLEKDMIDIKSRMRVLEARKNSGNAKSAAPAQAETSQ